MSELKKVMVTGATGYVAGHLVKKLLVEGHTVHAAVRDPSNTEKLKYLNELAAKSNGEIKYFKSDLLEVGSYAQAMEDCEIVFHTASPFTLDIKDPQKDLVDPALKGTQNVLETVNKTKSVKRVVLTSSCAAIYGDNKDLQAIPNKTLTEENWNETSSLQHQPYSYSKTVAEKKAWEMVKLQDRWKLVVINPSLVLGPAINPNGTSESFKLLKQFGDGTMKMGTVDYSIGAVDVRDVALAHYQAGFKEDANGRYITSAHDTSLIEMAELLREKFARYPLPKKTLPFWMAWLFGPISNKAMTRKIISNNLGFPFKADHSKIQKELNVEFRPLSQSLEEFFEQLIESGSLKRL